MPELDGPAYVYGHWLGVLIVPLILKYNLLGFSRVDNEGVMVTPCSYIVKHNWKSFVGIGTPYYTDRLVSVDMRTAYTKDVLMVKGSEYSHILHIPRVRMGLRTHPYWHLKQKTSKQLTVTAIHE